MNNNLKTKSNKITVFDTTLRDGEQSPGCSMNLEEKIKIAEVLESLNVDVIEAGFAIASNGDYEAIKEISKKIKEPIICSLARASKKDIERAESALKPAKRKRIHTFIATSELHMKYKLQLKPEEVHDLVKESVKYARNLVDDVEWSPEDGSRSDLDFLCRCIETAIKSGASTINIPDTVGYAMPMEFNQFIKNIMNKVPNIDKAVLSVHCHNDLGLAVANSLSAIGVGARQVECTVNGIGERAGNAALEELVMALKIRKDIFPYHTNINAKEITKASRLLSAITGFAVQPNKAIVGANAFSHESGIHQDGMLKHSQTYEIMSPESVGLNKSKLIMGKHSGKHAFKQKLLELGFDLGDNYVVEVFNRFKELADKKKDIFDKDIIALVDTEIGQTDEIIKLISLDLNCGTDKDPTVRVCIKYNEKFYKTDATGNGPVDSIFKAINKLVNNNAKLDLFLINAITDGTDAQAEVTVRLAENGKTVNGSVADTDTMVAAAKSYIVALNKLLTKREKDAPDAKVLKG